MTSPTGAVLYLAVSPHLLSGGKRLELFAYQVTEAVATSEEVVTPEAWERAGKDDPRRARDIARRVLSARSGEAVRAALLGADDRAGCGAEGELDTIVRTCGVYVDPS